MLTKEQIAQRIAKELQDGFLRQSWNRDTHLSS